MIAEGYANERAERVSISLPAGLFAETLLESLPGQRRVRTWEDRWGRFFWVYESGASTLDRPAILRIIGNGGHIRNLEGAGGFAIAISLEQLERPVPLCFHDPLIHDWNEGTNTGLTEPALYREYFETLFPSPSGIALVGFMPAWRCRYRKEPVCGKIIRSVIQRHPDSFFFGRELAGLMQGHGLPAVDAHFCEPWPGRML